MYELLYWCPARSQWLPVSGPDYTDAEYAVSVAVNTSLRSGRVVAVVDTDRGNAIIATANGGIVSYL